MFNVKKSMSIVKQLFIISLLLIGCNRQTNYLSYDETAWGLLRTSWTQDIPSRPPKDDPPDLNWAASTPFLASVIHLARQQNVPVEAALMPFLLSYYNNLAKSTPQHSGIWQIKKSNCRLYQLTCSDKYDERLHPVHSTLAVMKRLNILHQYYLSWETAFQAFYQEQNLYGQHAFLQLGSFSESIGRLKYRINYPEEKDDLTDISSEIYFETMLIRNNVNIIEIAQLSNIDANLWQQLNSYYLQGVTTQLHRELLVPVNALGSMKFPSASFSRTSYLVDTVKSTCKQLDHTQKVAASQAHLTQPEIQPSLMTS